MGRAEAETEGSPYWWEKMLQWNEYLEPDDEQASTPRPHEDQDHEFAPR